MAIRFATTSALALAASLLVAPAARAQGFFSFFEMSPRQVAGMLEDDGYRLRGPMLRRGDVYICDVVSITGRPARLIVDARDGRVLERFANNPHWRRSGDGGLRPPRDVGDNGQNRSWDNGDSSAGRQTAMGGDFNAPSRVYGSDALFGGWKSDAASTPNAEPRPKPKHHASKKHKEPAVAKDSAASPDASADAKTSDKPTDSSSLAAVAPSAGADVGKPDAAKTEATPRPMPSPDREQAKAEGEKRPIVAPSPAPKVEAPHKKLNDLPVGTLD